MNRQRNDPVGGLDEIDPVLICGNGQNFTAGTALLRSIIPGPCAEGSACVQSYF